ncbi:Tubulin-tyrosine ligase family protein, partial [Opisthorchis viverrini]
RANFALNVSVFVPSLKLKPTQRVNHHPPPTGTQGDITKKDGLLRAVRRMCATYPKCAPLLLLPTSFHLPSLASGWLTSHDRRSLRQCLSASNPKSGFQPQLNGDKQYSQECNFSYTIYRLHRSQGYWNKQSTKVEDCCENSEQHVCADCCSDPTQQVPNIWILKPADEARGKGIYLFNQLEQFAYFAKSVVQKYITDPLLIKGYKFDLRLYAVVPSYAPFIVYIYSEGLVRFATEPFDLNDLQNVYSHLTNTAINVNGPRYLLNKAANAYELFGFDILIDNHLRPWLLEVNANPSMSGTCIVDELVKKPLITSLLSMLRLSRRSPKSFLSNSISKHESEVKDIRTSSGIICLPIEQTAAHQNPAPSGQLCFSFKNRPTESKSKLPIRVTQIQNSAPGDNALGSALQRNEELNASLTSPDTHHDLIGQLFQMGKGNENVRECSANRVSVPLGMLASLDELHKLGKQVPIGGLCDVTTCIGNCSLYGSGSECLLPRLHALGDQFKHSYKLHKNPSLRTASKDVLMEPNGIAGIHGKRKAPKAIGEGCHPTFHSYSTCSKPCTMRNHAQKEEEQQHQQSGNELIPHAFGLMRLAFPFNLSTRIACASGRGGYPDVKSCVQQICRLMFHYARERRDESVVTDISVMDIPGVWDEGS